MGFVIQSTSTNNNNNANSIAIPKPSGLAVGNLMVAVLTANDAATTTVTTLSGWTDAISQAGNGGASIQFKIATAGDVAASDFTFAFSRTTVVAGSMLRLSNNLTTGILGGTNAYNATISATSSPTNTIAITPSNKEALIVVAMVARDNAVPFAGGNDSVTSYNTVPTLSFTELHDKGASNSKASGAAYAVQAVAAELTSYGAVFTSNKDRYLSILAVFNPVVDDSGSNTLATTNSPTFAQAGVADTIGGTTILATTSTTQFAQSGKIVDPSPWTPAVKTVPAWTDQIK